VHWNTRFIPLTRACVLLQHRLCLRAVVVVCACLADLFIALQEKGATKLQYKQFLHTLMLIADKRRSGFCEVVSKIQHYGIYRRDPSMADFLIMSDPGALYKDARDLERPAGLPKLHRTLGTVPGLPDTASPHGVSIMPSAAKGIMHPEAAKLIPGLSMPPAPQGPQKRRGQWGASRDVMSPAYIPSTGSVCGESLEMVPVDENDDVDALHDVTACTPDTAPAAKCAFYPLALVQHRGGFEQACMQIIAMQGLHCIVSTRAWRVHVHLAIPSKGMCAPL
jgi:hypothetical protein